MNLKQQIYHAIVDHYRRFGQVPQRDELEQSFRHDADGSLDAYLSQLAREGLIVLSEEPTNQISLADAAMRSVVEIGIQGHRAPGRGIIALDLGGIGLPLGDEAYALRVDDDGMIDAGIQTGDIAILRPGVPMRGDIVGAMIDNRLVLRRFLVIRRIPHLLAENPGQPDLRPAFDLHLQGVLCALLRIDFGRRPPGRPTAAISYLPGNVPADGDAGAPDEAETTAARPTQSKPAKSTWAQSPTGLALNEPAPARFEAKSKKQCSRASHVQRRRV